MDYETAKQMIAERVAQSKTDIGIFDLYSMIFTEDLQAVINMIDQIEEADEHEQKHWEYAYLLGQAIGNLDTAESILHYFGKTMGDNEALLRSAFEAIDMKLVDLHPVMDVLQQVKSAQVENYAINYTPLRICLHDDIFGYMLRK